jgi:hypothetical protein
MDGESWNGRDRVERERAIVRRPTSNSSTKQTALRYRAGPERPNVTEAICQQLRPGSEFLTTSLRSSTGLSAAV